jgi:MFS family permease
MFSVVLCAAAISFAALAFTGSVGFLEHRAHLQTYDTQRFGAQEFGIQQGERYPFGIGPGQFDVVSQVSAHSTYVRAFAEEGMPGLLTLLALLLATLLFATRNAVRGSNTYGIGSAALLGSWVGLLANSLFVDTLHWRHLWLVAALIWAGWMRGYRAADPAGAP